MLNSVILPILLLLCGVLLSISGVRTWIRKTAKFSDPFVWGPLTGGVGVVMMRSIFGDAEIKGFAARVLALFQLALGLALIVLPISNHFSAKEYAEIQARRAFEAEAIEAARRDGTLVSSLPLLPPPSKSTALATVEPPPAPSPAPAPPQAPLPAPVPASSQATATATPQAAAPASSQAPAPATTQAPAMATSQAAAPAPSQAQAPLPATPQATTPASSPPAPGQPATLQRMSKDWMPEGMRRRQ